MSALCASNSIESQEMYSYRLCKHLKIIPGRVGFGTLELGNEPKTHIIRLPSVLTVLYTFLFDASNIYLRQFRELHQRYIHVCT
jgi:hypothetical protein